MGIIKLKKNSNIKHYLGLKGVSIKTVGLWLGVLCVLLVSSYTILYFMGEPVVNEYVIQVIQTRGSTLLFILGVAIAAPIWEELFFRGFLFAGLSSTFLGVWGANVVQAFFCCTS